MAGLRATFYEWRPGAGPWLSWGGTLETMPTGCLGLNRVNPAEDHPARARLEHARDGESERLAQVVGALFGNDHRAIVKIADTLALFLAALEQLDSQSFAGEDDRLHGVGQVVKLMTSTPWSRAILLRL